MSMKRVVESLRVPRGISSIGRVPALQAGGTGIETLMLHFVSNFAWNCESLPMIPSILAWMAEWSKALDSSSSIARCVGSNPTSSIWAITHDA